MSNQTPNAPARFADDSQSGFLIRWRGRQEGPFTGAVIEAKLAANQIGLLHEISRDGQWVTLRDHLAERGAVARAEQQAREERERRARENAELQTQEMESQRRARALAEEGRKASPVELDNFHRQSTGAIHSTPSRLAGELSGLRIAGMLLLLGGLAVAAYFFLLFDSSVESGLGRVNNFGLMADRQNGILFGIGLCVVGTIMLVIGVCGKK